MQHTRWEKIMWKFICCYCNQGGSGWLGQVCAFFLMVLLLLLHSPFAIVSEFFVVHLAVAFLNSNFSLWAWIRQHSHIYTKPYSRSHPPPPSTPQPLAAFLFRPEIRSFCQRKFVLFYIHFHFKKKIFYFAVEQNQQRQRMNRQWISKTNLCLTNALNFPFFLSHCLPGAIHVIVVVSFLLRSSSSMLFFLCFVTLSDSILLWFSVAFYLRVWPDAFYIYSVQFFVIWQRQTVLKQLNSQTMATACKMCKYINVTHTHTVRACKTEFARGIRIYVSKQVLSHFAWTGSFVCYIVPCIADIDIRRVDSL